MEKIQKRTIIKGTIEARELTPENKEMVIAGVIPYNSPSEKMYIGYGDYDVDREIIAPTAFNKTIADKRNVFLNYNHNSDLILAATKSETMQLENKEDGLHFTATLPDTDIGIRAYTTIKRKDVTTLSFEFIPYQWETDKENKIVTVTSARLDAISLCVSNPAYTTTNCETRNFEEKIKTIKETLKEKELKQMDKEEIKELKELLLAILEKLPEENKEEEKPVEEENKEPIEDVKPAERKSEDEESKDEETSEQPEDTQTEETDEDSEDEDEAEAELAELVEELAALKKELEELKK